MQHEVIVGDVGTVYRGTSKKEAKNQYVEWVEISKKDKGRASGESVTWFIDGEIHKEKQPTG